MNDTGHLINYFGSQKFALCLQIYPPKVNVVRLNLRALSVAPFSFSQPQDDFSGIFEEARGADSIAVITPIYFNMPCAQAVTLLNRFFCIFQPDYEKSGIPKKLAVLATCGHGDPEKIKSVITEAIGFFAMEKYDTQRQYLYRISATAEWLQSFSVM